jgi:hypothetical protein
LPQRHQEKEETDEIASPRSAFHPKEIRISWDRQAKRRKGRSNMKKIGLMFLLSIICGTSLYADFIIPVDDPVYPFLESMQALGYTDKAFVIYPQYHNEVMKILNSILLEDISPQYRKLAKHHQSRLSLDFPQGISSAVYPPSKIPDSALDIFKPHSYRNRLLTYQEGEIQLLFSGMLGLNYDKKFADDDLSRVYKYYGLEFGGNIKNNFGFYTQYRKGNYDGDSEFILEDPHIHWSGGKARLVTTCSEVDFKNKYLNLSLGYGSFQVGRTITSSIILNQNVNPYSYFKYYTNYKNIYFLCFNSQLLPDSLSPVSEDYHQKSYALQTIYYSGDSFTFGLGQGAIYGDKAIDLAYLTPMMIYKLVDFKNHNRDNEVAFGFFVLRPLRSFQLYGNFFMDDLKKSRLFTEEALTGLAFQTGLTYNFVSVPIQCSFETTVVGPVTYGHSEEYGVETKYTHDTEVLGYAYGANLLNLAFQIRYMNPYLDFRFNYENMRQGSYGSDPFSGEVKPAKFLEGDVSRTQRFIFDFLFSLNPQTSIKIQYKNINEEDETNHYLFTGLEVRY